MNNMNNVTPEIRTACDQYLRRGIVNTEVLDEAPSGAGYLLPQHLESKLVNVMNTISVLRPLCTVVNTTGESALPIVNGHGKAVWVPEGHPIPLVKDAFDRAKLDSHKLAAIIRVTSELLKDSVIDLEQYLADTFADRLTIGEEETFIAGDGVDKPLGLIHQVKVGSTTENTGSVSIEDVLKLIFSVPDKYRRRGLLMMNDATLLNLCRQCVEKGPALWFGKTRDGQEDTFFGVRIVRCGSMPDVASGNMPVLFGDFRQVYINDCGKRGIKRLNELYAVNDHVGFAISERSGIKLTVPDAVKGLKVA